LPSLSSPSAIRSLLLADRPWSVYALGDLAPGFAAASEWFVSAQPLGGVRDAQGLLLLYRAFDTPVLFTLGPPAAVAPLLDEIAGERALYLSIRPDILPYIAARYRVSQLAAMWRMTLDPADFCPVANRARRLCLADLPALEALFADGASHGEAPDFFNAAMLADGVFFGLFEGSGLVAAAGTHLVAPGEGVAAIGNVYTRRDRRGRGLAAQVTAAVAAELLRHVLPLQIALNVNQANLAALRVYERLGFRRYCPFYEGLAQRP
jgi:ribosomal protein S18 acetylase RimI-like enzyme